MPRNVYCLAAILLSLTAVVWADHATPVVKLAEGEVFALQQFPAVLFTFYLDESVLRRGQTALDVRVAPGRFTTVQCTADDLRRCPATGCSAADAAVHTGRLRGDPSRCSLIPQGEEHVLCGHIFQGAGHVLEIKEPGEPCL